MLDMFHREKYDKLEDVDLCGLQEEQKKQMIKWMGQNRENKWTDEFWDAEFDTIAQVELMWWQPRDSIWFKKAKQRRASITLQCICRAHLSICSSAVSSAGY